MAKLALAVLALVNSTMSIELESKLGSYYKYQNRFEYLASLIFDETRGKLFEV